MKKKCHRSCREKLRLYLQNSGGTIPNTSTLSHSSRAMTMVNQPVLNQVLELFLEDKVTEMY